MTENITLEQVYALSDDVVVREIEGELIIIPIASGIGDMEDELYTLNKTGKVIFEKLNGARTLSQIEQDILAEFDVLQADLEQDILGLVSELVRRRILTRVE